MSKVIPFLFFPIFVLAINLLLNVTGIGVSKIGEEKSIKRRVLAFNIFEK